MPNHDEQLAVAAQLQQPNAAQSLLAQAVAEDNIELARAIADRAEQMIGEHPGGGWADVLTACQAARFSRPLRS